MVCGNYAVVKNNAHPSKGLKPFEGFFSTPRYKPVKNVLLFFIIVISIHLLWDGFESRFEQNDGYKRISASLASNVFDASSYMAELFFEDEITEYQGQTLYFRSGGAVAVIDACSGLKLLVMTFLLFLIFPGAWKRKLWFIPLAMLVMHVANILRVLLLFAAGAFWASQAEFIHLWVLRPMIYGVLFLLWVWWAERAGHAGLRHKDTKSLKIKHH